MEIYDPEYREAREENENLIRLFLDVFNYLMNENIEERRLENDEIIECLQKIKESFHFSEGGKFENVDYEKLSNHIAYTYRYGPITACLTRNGVLNAIKNNETLRSKFSSPEINIVSLGSGPGADIIGLLSALTQYVEHKKLRLTLVDSVNGWQHVFRIVENLVRQPNYGKSSLFFQNNTVYTSFLRTNLPGDERNDKEYFADLRAADVVFVKGLLSILRPSVKIGITEAITAVMKPGALLIYIDSYLSDPCLHMEYFTDLELIYSGEPIGYELEQTNINTEIRSSETMKSEDICLFSNQNIYVFIKRS